MYIAKFQGHTGYWQNLDNASTMDEAIKFLNQQIGIDSTYKNAFIKEQETGREIFAYRTIK